MALGVRSFGNSLLLQNVYNPDNLPDTIPVIKSFATKILRPSITTLEVDCETRIGRVIQIPEFDPVGLIELTLNIPITDQMVIDNLRDGIYIMRVRDTSTCVTARGVCSRCGRGYNARIGAPATPRIDDILSTDGSPRSYQNYIANTYSGSIMGYQALAEDPLPLIPRNWNEVTTHGEMDGICNLLDALNVNRDEMEYARGVVDILERALLLIGIYGVYASV